MTAEMHTNIFPNVFRILVIDDQICNDSACQKQVQNDSEHVKTLIRYYFKSVVRKVALKQQSKNEQQSQEIIEAGLPEIEVDFAKDPDEGVARWMESVYDLTLVDSDFSRDEMMMQKLDERNKRNFLDLDLEFAGAYLYHFLHKLLSGKEFGNARKGCRIALWTGLGLAKEDRAKRLISILPKSDDGLCLIPKKEGDVDGWRTILGLDENAPMTIEGIIGGMANDNFILNPSMSFVDDKTKSDSIIGRIKGLYRVKSPEDFSRLCGLDKHIHVGWLKEEDGGVFLSDERIEGGRLLSPLLRRGEDNDDFEILDGDNEDIKKLKRKMAKKREIENDFFSKTLLDIRQSNNGIIVPSDETEQKEGQQQDEKHDKVSQKRKEHIKEHIIAAATPLTGCSAVGRDYSIDLMVKKIKELLDVDGPFGKVVLKTVYLDSLNQWQDKKWPELQAQESHLTRCLRSTKHTRTLWNTGQTAMEAFTPEMMHDFLTKMPDKYRGRVIVSLGSKFPQANVKNPRMEGCQGKLLKIWGNLFDCVFKGLDGETVYPLVEINIRHYLREAIKALLGGHEYLSPAKITEPFMGNYDTVDREFKVWLAVLNEVAEKHGKRLLLKLPFRSDIFHFISVIYSFWSKGGTRIAGITLINAFKSAAGETEYGAPYSPASYTKPDVSRMWSYQMSGEMLTASRNELMGEISTLANSKEAKDFQIHLSGGIVDKTGLDFCLNCGKNVYVQIGTWALMDLNLRNQNWGDCHKDAPSIGSGKPQVLGCQECSTCQVNCPFGAFKKGCQNQSASIDRLKCTACQKCIDMCIRKGVRLGNDDTDCRTIMQSEQSSNSDELPRRIAFCLHELCNGCGKCSRTFYCDTFMDRRGLELPPLMDARNCTGCGLCAQTCPRGAIQLFRPEHIAILVGEKDDDLRRWHKFLFANEVPHLVFHLEELDSIKKSFLCDSIILKAEEDCSLEKLALIIKEVKGRLDYLREK